MRLAVLSILCVFSGVVFADPMQPVLNQVLYQTSVEQWVTTKTAEVVVDVNATMNEDALASAHDDITAKLNKLASADWHVTQFDRTPNESGLEQLAVEAQTRLSESALSNLREQAKAMSKPGETFTIQSITFEPTLAETEAVRTALRNQIYTQVQAELASLNKLYPNQHYVVHMINFGEVNLPQPEARMMMMGAVNAPVASPAPVTVANKLTLSAAVDLVSVNQ